MDAMRMYNLSFLLFFQLFVASIHAPESPAVTGDGEKTDAPKRAVNNVVLKSADGGKTWQDISAGLPDNLQGDGFIASESELYLSTGAGVYRSNPDAAGEFWKKEAIPAGHRSLAPGKTGIVAFNYANAQFMQRPNGTDVWSPVYANFPKKSARSVFETAAGTVFIGTDSGLYKSADRGKTWKHVQDGGWVIKIVEADGVMVATSQQGILRSADEGETWELVISEGGVGIAIERIEGGFAAITYSTALKARRIRTSYDGGKTWQLIDAGLMPHMLTASIVEAGGYFFCGHPMGIFRSADRGKTWRLLLPTIENKVFNLSVSGNVLYAMAAEGGC